MESAAKAPKAALRTITFEEHFATPAFLAGPGHYLPRQYAGRRIEQLSDLGDLRIKDMDDAGIDVQVLSLTAPGVEQLDADEAVALARDTNDLVADAMRRHPGRLAGFAVLPIQSPETSADELERAVRQLGFKGAVINGHTRGRYLDDTFFWPILERAEALKAPICLHPTRPPQAVTEAYYTGNFPAEVTALLSAPGWGWHIETAVHVIRIILSGALDRFPGLQLIVGHLGEGLPFMLPRMDRTLSREITKLDRSTGAYLRENVYYSFSGFNFLPTFLNLLMEVGVERILFSTDYPYGSMPEARAFLDALPVSPADKERIAHGNAELLMGF